jgi:hypothetical protein
MTAPLNGIMDGTHEVRPTEPGGSEEAEDHGGDPAEENAPEGP